MAIIVSKNGKNAQKVSKSDFEKEDYLQNYIHKNPESIPVYEIEEDKKLFVVKREFPTNAGPIDALAVDKDGDIYIIETKLYKNPDKRTVVAQALDYGSALWRHLNDFGDFINTLNQETQKNFGLDFQEKLEEFFGIDNDQSTFALDCLKKNLGDGNIKFVILMDSIEERLKDLIVYVNQNSQFDIYAVQLEYYKFNDYEIMIPKMFGVEVKKNIKSSGSNRRKWTREDFLLDARNKCNPDVYKQVQNIFEFSQKHFDKLMYGTGNDGVVSMKLNTQNGYVTPMRLEAGGTMIFGLDFILYQKTKLPEKMIHDFVKRIEKIKGVDVRDGVNFKRSEIYLQLEDLVDENDEVDQLKNEIIRFIELAHKKS